MLDLNALLSLVIAGLAVPNPVDMSKASLEDLGPPAPAPQKAVDDYFCQRASYWKNIYRQKTVYAAIHQERMELALKWIAELGLKAGDRVLEVGCGAGFMAAALASRGYHVTAIDGARSMVELTRQCAHELNLTPQLHAAVGDVHSLQFTDQSFDLVVALGVIPWLHTPQKALAEMARVVKARRYLLITADNYWRLHYCLDPYHSPPVRWAERALRRIGLLPKKQEENLARMQTPRQLDNWLAANQLLKVRAMTLGFGPFTFCKYLHLSDAVGIKVHGYLQRLAQRGVPPFRSTGAQYIVLATKTGPAAV